MARQIDYYFSTQSPWTYIGHALFEDVAASHGLKINYKPVQLGEVFSETGGLPLAKRHPARQRYRLMELQRWRDKRGLTFNLRPRFFPGNPRLADGVVIAALAEGLKAEPFMRRAFAALWEGESDLADPETIARIADAAGLPGAKLVVRSGTDEIGAIYDQNRNEAIAAGVFGAPSWVLDGEVFWGQDRIELLADALKAGRKAYGSDV